MIREKRQLKWIKFYAASQDEGGSRGLSFEVTGIYEVLSLLLCQESSQMDHWIKCGVIKF